MTREVKIKTALILAAIVVLVSVVGTALILITGGLPIITGLAAGTASVNVSESLSISLPRNVVSFGNQSPGASNQTAYNAETNTPMPFTLQNDGNLEINVTIYANADLFLESVADSPSGYYRANSSANESGTFNGTCYTGECGNGSSGSYNITWINIPDSSQPSLIAAGVQYANASNLADININITVPTEELPGNKSQTLTFTASQY